MKALMMYSCCTASVVLCTLVLIPPNTYLQFSLGTVFIGNMGQEQ